MATILASKEPQWLISGCRIDGMRHRFLDANRDTRGSFTEIFYDTWDTGIKPRQWSVVQSAARVLRGMHVHLEHDEYICVLRGRACIGLYDLRQDSETYRSHALVAIDDDRPACITFPSGILHGWYFHESSLHVQATSNTFEEYGGHDNWGCYFADPDLGIPWPDQDPILSERARNFPALNKLEAVLRRYRSAQDSNCASGGKWVPYGDTGVTKVKA